MWTFFTHAEHQLPSNVQGDGHQPVDGGHSPHSGVHAGREVAMEEKEKFLFEQPKDAKSWQEEAMKEVAALERVLKIECDICMFGLRVGRRLNKKPTGLMTNCEEIAEEMNKKCDHTHFHEPLEGSGKTRKAQPYTPQSCQSILKGFKKYLRRQTKDKAQFLGENLDDEEEDALDQQRLPDEVEEEPRKDETISSYEPTVQEKQVVLKLRKGVGHPQMPELIRLMRAARVRGEIVQWAAKHFKCEACAANPRPKTVRPVSMPRTYQPCKVISMDLIFIPEVGDGREFPALSIVDWGSNYQMVEKVSDKQPETMWSTLWSTWVRVFGLPEVLVVDVGKEFSQRLMSLAGANGQRCGLSPDWSSGTMATRPNRTAWSSFQLVA